MMTRAFWVRYRELRRDFDGQELMMTTFPCADSMYLDHTASTSYTY